MNTYYLIIPEASSRALGMQNVSELGFRHKSYGGETEVHVAQTLTDARHEMTMMNDKTDRMFFHDRYAPNNALIVEVQSDKPIKEIEDELKVTWRDGFPKTTFATMPSNIKVNVVATHTHKPVITQEMPLPREPARTKNFLAKMKDDIKDVLHIKPHGR